MSDGPVCFQYKATFNSKFIVRLPSKAATSYLLIMCAGAVDYLVESDIGLTRLSLPGQDVT